MRRGSLILPWTIAGTLLVLLVAQRGVSQQTEKPGAAAAAQPQMSAEMAERMANWERYNALGPEHAQFKEMVGEYNADMLWWMEPNTPPMTFKGKAKFELILDGHYLKQTYTCPDMMGTPYTGIGIEGYDRFAKRYVSIWLDNMSNSIMMQYGKCSESGKVCTYYGREHDSSTGELDKVVKAVLSHDGDVPVFSMYELRPDNTEFKGMEIRYKRVAK